MRQRLDKLSERLASLERMRLTLGYTETLRRGYAVVRGESGVLTTRAAAEAAGTFEIEFQDGRLPATSGDAPKPKKPKGDPPPFHPSAHNPSPRRSMQLHGSRRETFKSDGSRRGFERIQQLQHFSWEILTV